MFAVSEGGCSRGDEWLHKGIVGNGPTVAFLMALYERWRESDGSHMEPTLTRAHTHTLTHSCPPLLCFGETPAPVSPLRLSLHLSLPLYPSQFL